MKNRSLAPVFPAREPFDLPATTRTVSLADLFAERLGSGFNVYNLFLAHFQDIPNVRVEMEIDCNKACRWFIRKYGGDIRASYYQQLSDASADSPDWQDVYCIIYEDLLINFDGNSSFVRFLYQKTSRTRVDELVRSIRRFRKRKKKPASEVCIVVDSGEGLEVQPMEISRPLLTVGDNYNDNFLEIHERIRHRLLRDKDKGLVLLHGKPGTGKTSYLRFLIRSLKKRVIFVPPRIATSISNPEFLNFLARHRNSIMVIEDAEGILLARERREGSPVTALLNMADGLLSDYLHIQFICTFNCDISKIDEALLRRGRLIALYEFRELEKQKAQALAQKLGFATAIDQPMTLAAIYNQQDIDFSSLAHRSGIGFRRPEEVSA